MDDEPEGWEPCSCEDWGWGWRALRVRDALWLRRGPELLRERREDSSESGSLWPCAEFENHWEEHGDDGDEKLSTDSVLNTSGGGIGGTGGISSWFCCEYKRDVVGERGCEWDDDERTDEVPGTLSLSSMVTSWPRGAGPLVTNIPVISFIPTPKKRESFAARRRRMRNTGSEGLTSDAPSGLAKPGEIREDGENCDSGEAGADTDPEELPHWNIVMKGGGLTARNTLRIGDGKEL